MLEISESVSYQLCLLYFASLCDYLIGLQKDKYLSFGKKNSEIKAKMTLQLSWDLMSNTAVFKADGRVAAHLEQWQR